MTRHAPLRPLRRAAVALALALPAIAFTPEVYPLDGYERTGIRRLRAYAMIQEGTLAGNVRLTPGSQLGWADIGLNLAGVNDDFDLPRNAPTDPELQRGLERIFGARDGSYRAALLDITDPENPRYAAIRPDQGFIPGSVGKLLVTTALFHEVAERFPNDLPARMRFLRDVKVAATDWALPNSHTVPIVEDDFSAVTHRAIRVGDTFSLFEWMDHALSPSSNAAGTMVWREAMLMDVFGDRYPVPESEVQEWIRATPRNEISDRAIQVLEAPLLEMGLDTELLRLRTFFTRGATAVVPGRGSHATPRTLLRWLTKLEQGQVVDPWSSLEIKRLMYFTRRRYRYAASPALANAAVFFKSGSLFRCQEEEGYQCVQYMGNVENLMHSVAIVESPAGTERARVYLISMMSNVLRVNSAGEHAEIATAIDRLVASLHTSP